MPNEEILNIVRGLRPIDDDYMNIIFNNNIPLVEYVLRVFLDKADLVIEESKTQYKTNLIGSRNVTFDVLAKDSSGARYNIEVQRSGAGAIAQRARYHSAALDVKSLPPSSSFKELLDSYIVFITESDVLSDGQPLYFIERSIKGSNKDFNDGTHIVYVNCAYKNVDTAVGKLIHDFMCSQSGDMLCEPMAEITDKYKNTPEGVDYMCRAVEEYGLKKEKEGIEKGIQKGIFDSIIKFIKKGKLSYEEIADNFDIPVEEVRKLAAQAH